MNGRVAAELPLPQVTSSSARSTTVSVVMAAYNGERFIRSQLESIIACLSPGDELIVVDDASEDRTLQILGECEWPGLILLRNRPNQGVRRSFERGLRQARGEVIFLSDQDDLWVPGKRDAFIAEFEADPLCTVVISDAAIIDAEGREIAPSFMQTRGGFRGEIAANLIRNRYMGCAMAVRASMLRYGLPIPACAPMHDGYLGLVGALTGTVRYLDMTYLLHRRHGRNASPSSRAGWLQVVSWRLGLLRALAAALSRPGMRQAMSAYRRDRCSRQVVAPH
jgi:glycosyltransferase involved in cell wall biosynthesis